MSRLLFLQTMPFSTSLNTAPERHTWNLSQKFAANSVPCLKLLLLCVYSWKRSPRCLNWRSSSISKPKTACALMKLVEASPKSHFASVWRVCLKWFVNLKTCLECNPWTHSPLSGTNMSHSHTPTVSYRNIFFGLGNFKRYIFQNLFIFLPSSCCSCCSNFCASSFWYSLLPVLSESSSRDRLVTASLLICSKSSYMNLGLLSGLSCQNFTLKTIVFSPKSFRWGSSKENF